MTTLFKQAQEAIDDRDADRLRSLLQQSPELALEHEDYSNTLLHHAASAGDVQLTEILIDAGSMVDGPGNDDGTPLHWAASMGNTAVCRQLIEAGADLHRSDGLGEGGTPLVQAIFYAARETAEYLATRAITPSNLRVAAGLGRQDLILKFFDETGQLLPSAGRAREWYRPHDESPERPTTDDPQEVLAEALCYACLNNRQEAVPFLLDHGANPDLKPHYATALHFATAAGNHDLINLLLDRGCDPTILDDCYDSDAAGWAEWGGAEETAALLRQRAASWSLSAACAAGDMAAVVARLQDKEANPISDGDLAEALRTALRHDHADIARLLREHGAKLSLPVAARLGQLDDVRRELANGADPNAVEIIDICEPGVGNESRSLKALMAAAINHHSDVCQLLLAAGADTDAFDLAALNDDVRLSEVLDSGFDLSARDPIGRTMLHRAIQAHAIDAVRLLLERGSDVDQAYDRFSFGGRALHLAAECDTPPEIIQLLLDHGADINRAMNPGTPLDCANRCGNEDLAELLTSLGAKTTEQLDAELAE